MLGFFKTIIYQPLFNLLVLFYNIIGDLGIAIVMIVVFVKLVLYPLNRKSVISQKKIQKIQPKIKELQNKYKDNKEEMTKQLMSLYQENKVNPMTGCLPLLIQFPIIISLFEIFLHLFEGDKMNLLYSFVKSPGTFNVMFLGIINLTQVNIYLAILAAIAQFVQMKMMLPKESLIGTDFTAVFSKMSLYGFPVLTLMLGLQWPATLPLFWLVLTGSIVAEQKIIEKSLEK